MGKNKALAHHTSAYFHTRGQASPCEVAIAQNNSEPAVEREVIEAAPGQTAIAVITFKLIYRLNRDAQDVVYNMPAETTRLLKTLPCRSFVDEKGLVRYRSCTLAT